MPSKYAIIDIETTGGEPNRDRITEVAIVVSDGCQVIEKYSSLINPERSIPYNIQQLTGITDQMVADAPHFFEVAKKIVELTKDTIFVAHNAQFDYGFIQQEFKRLGFNYVRKRLCTVRLARKIIPGHTSYSLGRITADLGIRLDGHHRALNDAVATADLFHLLVEKDDGQINEMLHHGVIATRLPPTVSLELLDSLPESCGIYYFYNKNKEVIYVGKSINIRKRVAEHFAAKEARKIKMAAEICDISYEITGSELVSLLMESHEIKSLKPTYNRAQKPKQQPYSIYHYKDVQGVWRLNIAKQPKNVKTVASFSSSSEAKNTLQYWAKQYTFCAHLCSDKPLGSPCFSYHLHQCRGVCVGEESIGEHNLRIKKLLDTFVEHRFTEDFFIAEEGRNPQELAIVLVKDGYYLGYGFVEKEEAASVWYEAISAKKHNADTAQIIHEYIHREKKRRFRKIMLNNSLF